MRRRGGRARRVSEAEAKARAYELLALGFSPPSPELEEALARPGAPLSLPAPEPGALAPEYHRLFVGPGHLPAPPYESVYREGGTLMGETTLDVQRTYLEAGYTLDPSCRELPDHVAAELTFMALLCKEEAQAWAAGNTTAALSWIGRQETFLRDHLFRWLPAFCDRLMVSTESQFYRSLAVALREFLALEAERLAALDGLLHEAPA